MNDASQPQNGGARKPKRAPAGSRGPEQAYPDPPRSWTRAGILLGGWVAAWTGVLFFGMGLQAVAQSQEDERLPLDGQAVTREFARLSLQSRDHEQADALLCEDFEGPTSQDLASGFDELVAAANSGGLIDVSVWASEPQTQPETFRLNLTYGSKASPSIVRYLSTTTASEDDDCIARLEERAAEPDPEPDEPDSDESPTEGPGAEATVSDFLAAIFRDQDQHAAASLQCSDYAGISLEDLLSIRADHVHEGAGSTQYNLALEGRAHPDADNTDLFSAVIQLDDETHEFMVLFDPGDQRRCVISVEER